MYPTIYTKTLLIEPKPFKAINTRYRFLPHWVFFYDTFLTFLRTLNTDTFFTEYISIFALLTNCRVKRTTLTIVFFTIYTNLSLLSLRLFFDSETHITLLTNIKSFRTLQTMCIITLQTCGCFIWVPLNKLTWTRRAFGVNNIAIVTLWIWTFWTISTIH